MLSDQKKGVAAIIVAGGPKEEEAGPDKSDQEMLAEEILSSIDKKDAKGFLEAMKAFLESCKEGESEEGEEE